MSEGRIIKAISGYYYVQLRSEDDSGRMIRCRARGVFKKRNISPLVGDLVKIEFANSEEGTVVEVLPRRNELSRPPIANVDQAVLVFALSTPGLSYALLDRLLVHTEYAGIDAVICLTKADLDEEEVLVQKIRNVYGKMDYHVLLTSALTGQGVEELTDALSGKISVLAGQSGVGKSTILNKLIPGLQLKTGEVSTKLGRGKHTTRHVELIPFKYEGAVADTPGFSQLDFPGIEPEQLSDCFKEIRAHSLSCKFRGCLHAAEPGCAVTEAVSSGEISSIRYENYISFLQEIKDKTRRY